MPWRQLSSAAAASTVLGVTSSAASLAMAICPGVSTTGGVGLGACSASTRTFPSTTVTCTWSPVRRTENFVPSTVTFRSPA